MSTFEWRLHPIALPTPCKLNTKLFFYWLTQSHDDILHSILEVTFFIDRKSQTNAIRANTTEG